MGVVEDVIPGTDRGERRLVCSRTDESLQLSIECQTANPSEGVQRGPHSTNRGIDDGRRQINGFDASADESLALLNVRLVGRLAEAMQARHASCDDAIDACVRWSRRSARDDANASVFAFLVVACSDTN